MKLNIIFIAEGSRAAVEKVNHMTQCFGRIEAIHCLCLCCGTEEAEKWLCDMKKRRTVKDIFIYRNEKNNTGINEVDSPKAVSQFIKDKEENLTIIYGNHDGFYAGTLAAAAMKRQCITDVVRLDFKDGKCTAQRKVYSAHADGIYRVSDKALLIISSQSPQNSYEKETVSAEVQVISVPKADKAEIKIIEESPKKNDADISEAALVFIGGRGLGSKAHFEIMAKTAKKFGAAVGCTRAAAMSGWCDYDKVVGVSGKSLSAKLCVLFGISGAAPFLSGIENAERVIAVNKDEKAPVFLSADDGIIGDCMAVLEAMGKEEE